MRMIYDPEFCKSMSEFRRDLALEVQLVRNKQKPFLCICSYNKPTAALISIEDFREYMDWKKRKEKRSKKSQ